MHSYIDIDVMRFISKSEQQTINFAKRIAKNLKGGDVLGLVGDLGTGKTVFVKGLAKVFGINCAHSPTFVLMHVHKINKKLSITNYQLPIKSPILKYPKILCHIDAYRLKNGMELLDIGADEYIGNPEIITVIEWAEKVKKILPKNTKWIFFKHYSHPLKKEKVRRGRKIENWRIIETKF